MSLFSFLLYPIRKTLYFKSTYMIRLLITTALVIVSFSSAFAQKEITLEDIWQNYAYYARSVPGFNFLNDGQHYTRLEKGKINKYDLVNGAFVSTLLDEADLKTLGLEANIDSYEFNGDESKIILKTNTQQIYRRSSTAIYYIYDRNSKSLSKIYDDAPISYPTLSPDNEKIAFVTGNNLYYKNLDSGEIVAVTSDGVKNKIINGSTDWVYEEEFSIVKAFVWSPGSDEIAFIRFDETEVPEFTMTLYNDNLYPEYVTWKYPKVGEKNANVSAHVYHLNNKKTDTPDLGTLDDIYLPRIRYTNQDDELIVYKMNRHQNHLWLYKVNTDKNESSILLEEENKYYIDITDDLTFLDNGDFIWTSEKDGYNHIYLHKKSGELKRQLTKGAYDVSRFYGVSEKKGKIYYQAAKRSHLEKEVFSKSLKGGDAKSLSPFQGSSSAQFSSTYDYYVVNNSSINTPPKYTVWTENKLIRSIEDNANLQAVQKEIGVSEAEFFTFRSEHGVRLGGYMIKPHNFDPNKQYPVFMYQYSGPGSQSANNAWKGNNYWWFQMLAQQGYIVACVDGRGTGMQGQEFKKMTYLNLGKYETIDQIDAAKYLASLDYVDGERIGIYGWSYGGYMSSLCILKGADVFKAAIAVAPVTSWKWYDSVYTERYMRTLAENEAGYTENSPVYFADKLKGAYLLVHGNADDNVHFQNAAEMANALIKANKQFDTYYYPNRNHGIYGDNARIHLFTKMTNFIKENI